MLYAHFTTVIVYFRILLALFGSMMRLEGSILSVKTLEVASTKLSKASVNSMRSPWPSSCCIGELKMCAGKVGRKALKSNIEERFVPTFSTAKRMASRAPGGFLIGVEEAVNSFVVLFTMPTSITRPVKSIKPLGFDAAAPVPIGKVLLVAVPAVAVWCGGIVVTGAVGAGAGATGGVGTG